MATEKQITAPKDISFEVNGDVVRFKSGLGHTFSLCLTNLSPEAKEKAVVFGVVRKVINAAALDKGSSVTDKWTAVEAVASRLNLGGGWDAPKGERATRDESGLVLVAMARVYSCTVEKSRADVEKYATKKGLDYKASLKMWGNSSKVATAMAEIKAERAAALAQQASLDSDSMMNELGDDDTED